MLATRRQRTLVVDGGVGAEGGLLVALALELGQDGAGNGETRHLVLLGQLEAEALGVVVDVDDLGELERQEALVAAGKGSLGGLLGCGAGLGAAAQCAVVVGAAAEDRRAEDVDGGIAAAAAAAGARRRRRRRSGSGLGRSGSSGLGSRRASLGREATSVLLSWSASTVGLAWSASICFEITSQNADNKKERRLGNRLRSTPDENRSTYHSKRLSRTESRSSKHCE